MKAFSSIVEHLKKEFLLLIFTSISAIGFSQPDIDWQHTFGGTLDEQAESSTITQDGGMIIAGYTESNDGDVTENQGGKDYWVVKLDSDGNLDWQQTYGGSLDDIAYSITQTLDGGYIVAGRTSSSDGDVSSFHGSRDYWVVKLDSNGTIEWEQTYGGSGNDEAKSIIETADGGYMVAGFTLSDNGQVTANNGLRDYWMVKIDPTGGIQWEQNFGGSGNEYLWSIKQTADNGYLLTGDSDSTDGDVSGNQGLTDYWIVKTDSFGTMEWQKNYGGSDRERPRNALQTPDGGYFIVGGSESSDGDISNHYDWYDSWVLKLDASGNIVWEKSFGGSFGDYAESILEMDNGNYLIGAYSQSSDGDVGTNYGNFDLWVYEMDASGAIIWEQSYGGSHHDYLASISISDLGNILIGGYSYSDDGQITGNHGGSDFISLQLESLLSTDEFSDVTVTMYPNPVETNLLLNSEIPIVEISISNLLGQEVYHKKGTTIASVSMETLPKGIYLVTATTADGNNFTQKISKQ